MSLTRQDVPSGLSDGGDSPHTPSPGERRETSTPTRGWTLPGFQAETAISESGRCRIRCSQPRARRGTGDPTGGSPRWQTRWRRGWRSCWSRRGRWRRPKARDPRGTFRWQNWRSLSRTASPSITRSWRPGPTGPAPPRFTPPSWPTASEWSAARRKRSASPSRGYSPCWHPRPCCIMCCVSYHASCRGRFNRGLTPPARRGMAPLTGGNVMDRYWLLTSTTYGTWLPGDSRGFVSNVADETGRGVRHNERGTPCDLNLPALRAYMRRQMIGDPLFLNEEQAGGDRRPIPGDGGVSGPVAARRRRHGQPLSSSRGRTGRSGSRRTVGRLRVLRQSRAEPALREARVWHLVDRARVEAKESRAGDPRCGGLHPKAIPPSRDLGKRGGGAAPGERGASAPC